MVYCQDYIAVFAEMNFKERDFCIRPEFFRCGENVLFIVYIIIAPVFIYD